MKRISYPWHNLLKTCEKATGELSDEQQKILQMVMLRTFYQTPYPGEKTEDLEQPEQFYKAYEERREMIGINWGYKME